MSRASVQAQSCRSYLMHTCLSFWESVQYQCRSLLLMWGSELLSFISLSPSRSLHFSFSLTLFFFSCSFSCTLAVCLSPCVDISLAVFLSGSHVFCSLHLAALVEAELALSARRRGISLFFSSTCLPSPLCPPTPLLIPHPHPTQLSWCMAPV